MSFGKWRHCRRPSSLRRGEGRKVTEFFFLHYGLERQFQGGKVVVECSEPLGFERQRWNTARHSGNTHSARCGATHRTQSCRRDCRILLTNSWLANILRSNQARCLKTPQRVSQSTRKALKPARVVVSLVYMCHYSHGVNLLLPLLPGAFFGR